MRLSAGLLNYGWVEASISEALTEASILFTEFEFSLVTSLDSTANLREARIGRTITNRYDECSFLGDALVVPVSMIAFLHDEYGLFNGFDEIWFFEDRPSVPFAREFSIVGPQRLDEASPPATLAEWVMKSRCGLGLGDGIGMNYVTTSDSLARRLEEEF